MTTKAAIRPCTWNGTEVPNAVATFGRGTRTLLLGGAVCVVGFGIHSSRNVLLPVLFGFLFAAGVQPLVRLLEGKRVPSVLAIAAGLAAMLVLLAAAAGTLVWGMLTVVAELPHYQAALSNLQAAVTRLFASHDLSQAAILVQRQQLLSLRASDVSAVIDFSFQVIGFAMLSGLVAFFGLIERTSLVRRLSLRENTSWQRILADTQRYLGIKALTAALTGVLAAAICAATGLSNPALWGAIAFWLNYIPVVGSILAGVPPVAIAYVTHSPELALIVLLGYLVINLAIGSYLEPRWLGAAAGLSPLVVILSVGTWAALLGPLGALLAVPLTMTSKIGCFHTRDLAWVARFLGHIDEADSALEPESVPVSETARASLFG